MISHLRLRNFQCHALLEIALDQHITTIVGPSDTGKSAILRALRWVLQNTPDGDDFIRFGADNAWASLCVDGTWYARKRGKAGNKYLQEVDGEWSPFVSFGREVPEPVARVFNVTDLNFQGQHDAPFWFTESGGQLSRELNRLVNLQAMDNALAHIAAKSRKLSSELDVCRDRKARAEQQTKDLDWVEDAAAALTNLETQQKNLRTRRDIARDVRVLLQQVTEHQTKRTTADTRILAATSLAKQAKDLNRLGLDAKRLRTLLESRLEHAKAAKQTIPDLSGLQQQLTDLEDTRTKRDRLRELLFSRDVSRLAWANRNVNLAKAQTELAKIKVCPTCQRPQS